MLSTILEVVQEETRWVRAIKRGQRQTTRNQSAVQFHNGVFFFIGVTLELERGLHGLHSTTGF